MINLTLLTGTNHPYRMEYILPSIVDANELYKGQVRIHWCICIDQYNSPVEYTSDSYIRDLFDKVVSKGLQCSIYTVGKPNQPNYGGDLFNEPFYDVYKESKVSFPNDGEPWFYVLDDDNILHPFVTDTLIKCNRLHSDKKIILMSKYRETGITDQCPPAMAFNSHWDNSDLNFTPTQLAADPSQLIIRGDLINEVGGYGSGFRYDFDWCLPLCRDHKDEVFFFTDWNPNSIDIIHCYHNGLRTLDDLNSDLNNIDTKLTACHLYIGYADESNLPKIYPIRNKELIKNILKDLKDEVGVR